MQRVATSLTNTLVLHNSNWNGSIDERMMIEIVPRSPRNTKNENKTYTRYDPVGDSPARRAHGPSINVLGRVSRGAFIQRRYGRSRMVMTATVRCFG